MDTTDTSYSLHLLICRMLWFLIHLKGEKKKGVVRIGSLGGGRGEFGGLSLCKLSARARRFREFTFWDMFSRKTT